MNTIKGSIKIVFSCKRTYFASDLIFLVNTLVLEFSSWQNNMSEEEFVFLNLLHRANVFTLTKKIALKKSGKGWVHFFSRLNKFHLTCEIWIKCPSDLEFLIAFPVSKPFLNKVWKFPIFIIRTFNYHKPLFNLIKSLCKMTSEIFISFWHTLNVLWYHGITVS